ncbi:MAG: Flp pilus assembly complex ATPase component TadA [Candidatus Eremiobacteraeota bacterium]|nr:Flp pilus assembly complex ATPase component TadA [Candidatus Eremiobacteraeota bacterium]
MARKRVGELLLETGVITEEQLAIALKTQKNTKERLGKILVDKGFIDQARLAEVLAQQSGFPLVDLSRITKLPDIAKTIPIEFCMNNKVIPISRDGGRISLAVSDPFDVVTVDLLSLMTGCEVEVCVATESDILELLEKLGPSCWKSPEFRKGEEISENLQNLLSPEEQLLIGTELEKEQDLTRIDSKKIYIPLDTLRMVPREFCIKNKLIPLRQGEHYLLVAVADPSDVVTLDMLKVMTSREIKTVQFPQATIEELLDRLYTEEVPLDELVSIISSTSNVEVIKSENENDLNENSKSIDLQNLKTESETGPIIRLANSIIINSIKSRASDIHIEPRDTATQIRFRIDGLLKNIAFLPPFVHIRLISRFKIMAGMDIAETRSPQDGRCRIRMKKDEFDLRMSTVPTFYGEKLVIRILHQGAGSIGLDKLGLSDKDYKAVQTAITAQQGIILVTGPTGSGKSSTLFSMLEVLKSETKNIITIEDPIEYDIPGINQIQVNERANLTFASGLRSILRQDPDVVMVGEIRDEETAEIAFHAAMTGHVVLSTLHTNDAPTSVIRLREMGLSPYLISASLKVIIAQRLVRTICKDCKEEYEATEEICDLLGIEYKKGLKFYKGKGCKSCGFSGYRGRTGIFEVLVLNDNIRDLIYKEASNLAIAESAKKSGMKLLKEDAIDKALKGITTPDEVLRVISQAELFDHWKVCDKCGTRIKPGLVSCPGCGKVFGKEDDSISSKDLKDLEKNLEKQAIGDLSLEQVDLKITPLAQPQQLQPQLKDEEIPDGPGLLCPTCHRPVNPAWRVCPSCMMPLWKNMHFGRTCPVCSARLNPEWAACPFCQTPVGTAEHSIMGRCCPYCAEEVEPDWIYCPNCHNRINKKNIEYPSPPPPYNSRNEAEIIPFRKLQSITLSPSVSHAQNQKPVDMFVKRVKGYRSFEVAIITEGEEEICKFNHIEKDENHKTKFRKRDRPA